MLLKMSMPVNAKYVPNQKFDKKSRPTENLQIIPEERDYIISICTDLLSLEELVYGIDEAVPIARYCFIELSNLAESVNGKKYEIQLFLRIRNHRFRKEEKSYVLSTIVQDSAIKDVYHLNAPLRHCQSSYIYVRASTIAILYKLNHVSLTCDLQYRIQVLDRKKFCPELAGSSNQNRRTKAAKVIDSLSLSVRCVRCPEC